MPMATAANSEPKRAPSCRWSSGCLAIFGSSANVPVHSSGMNRSLTTMSLLAVPLRPLTCQTSSICTWLAGTTPSRAACPVVENAVDADVVGVVGAAGERPAAAEPVAALVPHRLAGRVDHAAVDDVRAVREDLVVGVRRQVGVEARPLRADRRHPGDRGVGPRQLLDHGQALVRPHLVAAVRTRHVPAEDAGRPQLLGEVTGHGPRLLDLLGARLDLRAAARGRCQARSSAAAPVLRFRSLASLIVDHGWNHHHARKISRRLVRVTMHRSARRDGRN